MNKGRAVLFNIALALWTVGIALAYLPCLLLSARHARKVGRPWARGCLWLVKRICRIDFRLEGTEYIRNAPVIYASKHQSALEIAVLMSLFPAPAFILKRSLLFIPFFGQYLWRMKMIAIDRKGGANAMKKMIKDCMEALHARRPLVIFPEGTRMPPGEKGRYHPGVASIYQLAKVPVIPVAVNTGLLWPKNRWIKNPGTATIRFLPPITPGLPPREFRRQLEGTIDSSVPGLPPP